MSDRNGYGYANTNMVRSLERLGYEVNPNDPTADVEVWFDQPEHWTFSPGTYKIGYFPWESTQLKPNLGWHEALNACDEVWTPSALIAGWLRDYMDIHPPVYVYEHGVDPIWTPVERKVEGTFTFLHLGSEAARKGAKEAMESLRLTFAKSEDVRLKMKMWSPGIKNMWLPRVDFINKSMTLEELIQLYHDCNVFVYPSWGEGFGLTPLQAMATGMPTITVPAWAPYERFLDDNLKIDSKLSPSPWSMIHPGLMFEPNRESLRTAMRYAYENYDEVQANAHAKIDELLAFYDWDRLTKEAFENLEKRLENK